MTAYQTNILSQLIDFFEKPRALPTLGPNRIRILDASNAIAAAIEESTELDDQEDALVSVRTGVTQLREALSELLNSPDLNLDTLEDATRASILAANSALEDTKNLA